MTRSPSVAWVLDDQDALRLASLRLDLIALVDRYERRGERAPPDELVDAIVTIRELVERIAAARFQLPFPGMPRAVVPLQRGDERAFMVELPVIRWAVMRTALALLARENVKLAAQVEHALHAMPPPDALHAVRCTCPMSLRDRGEHGVSCPSFVAPSRVPARRVVNPGPETRGQHSCHASSRSSSPRKR